MVPLLSQPCYLPAWDGWKGPTQGNALSPMCRQCSSPRPKNTAAAPILQGKGSFHSLSVTALGALIGFNCPISPTWAPHPPTHQLSLNSGLST